MLSSVELQVLTSSCFKLRTVHNIPVTSNKDGKKWSHSYVLAHLCVPLLLPLFSVFSFNSQKQKHKKCLLPSQQKKPHNKRGLWGGALQENVGYNMFLIQLVAARATQWVGSGPGSARSSCMFVFVPDLHDAPLSEPRGDIKAIWLTYSDLLKWHLHAHIIHRPNHRADRERGRLAFSFWRLTGKKTKKDPSLLLIQCASQPLL